MCQRFLLGSCSQNKTWQSVWSRLLRVSQDILLNRRWLNFYFIYSQTFLFSSEVSRFWNSKIWETSLDRKQEFSFPGRSTNWSKSASGFSDNTKCCINKTQVFTQTGWARFFIYKMHSSLNGWLLLHDDLNINHQPEKICPIKFDVSLNIMCMWVTCAFVHEAFPKH